MKIKRLHPLLVSSVLLFTISALGQGSLEKVAVSLHDNWYVQSSANLTSRSVSVLTANHISPSLERERARHWLDH